MVLGALIALTIGQFSPPQRVPNDPDLVSRLRNFAKTVCAIDVAGRGAQPFRDGEPTSEESPDAPGDCAIHIGELFAIVAKSGPRIFSARLSSSMPEGRAWDDKSALTPTQVADDVQRICDAAYYGMPVTVWTPDAMNVSAR
jgi:hypothetical protein